MDSVKYIGMDVHKEAIAIAVLNYSGRQEARGRDALTESLRRAVQYST